MKKQWEPERSRVEHANDARITFTIALHGDHAWKICWKIVRTATACCAGVALYDPPLCSPATRAEDNLSDGWRKQAIAA